MKPAAWVRNLTDPQPHCVTDLKYMSAADVDAGVQYVPLYTKREWQGLTEEEYTTIMQQADHDAAKTGSVFQNFRYAIEAKLKEKNT